MGRTLIIEVDAELSGSATLEEALSVGQEVERAVCGAVGEVAPRIRAGSRRLSDRVI